MRIGLIGLGKMGGNMRERLRRGGVEVVGLDHNQEISDAADEADLIAQLGEGPRVVWLMVPIHAVDALIETLKPLLSAGDVIIDGGNSKWTHDARHAAYLADKGIHFVDVGTSGGVWGLENGYALMVGGPKEAVELAMPAFEALKPEGEFGFVHAGESGAGHFAKMVHNGIEYGLMQAYAEGYELLTKQPIVTDVPGAFKAWTRGTVVRSWLLDLLNDALTTNPTLADVSDYTVDSGEGRWTVEEAIAHDVPMPVISAALFARFASRQAISPTMQAVAALRGEFGGHAVASVADGERLKAATPTSAG